MTDVTIQTAGEGITTVAPSVTWSGQLGRTMGSRLFVYTVVVLGGAVFLYESATTHDAVRAFLALGVIAAVCLIAAAWHARGMAESAKLQQYAHNRGLSYTEKMQLLETTPLLGAGDKHWCEHYMEGPLSTELPDVRFGLAHFVFEDCREVSSRRGKTVEAWTPHRFTICVAEYPAAMEKFSGIFVIRRRGLFKAMAETTWLDFNALRKVQLESERFNQRFDLYVPNGMATETVLELFEPSFQVWMGELPFELYFEYHAGTLVMYRYKHETDDAGLDALVYATGWVAKRLREAVA